jgi:hypothetical protein
MMTPRGTRDGTACFAFQNGRLCTAGKLCGVLNTNRSRVQMLSDKTDRPANQVSQTAAASARKPLSPEAQRALAEAAARRAEADRLAAEAAKTRPRELQGPKGPEPTRYGDWENKGIASDF